LHCAQVDVGSIFDAGTNEKGRTKPKIKIIKIQEKKKKRKKKWTIRSNEKDVIWKRFRWKDAT